MANKIPIVVLKYRKQGLQERQRHALGRGTKPKDRRLWTHAIVMEILVEHKGKNFSQCNMI